MKNSEFEASLERLYAQEHPSTDDDVFVRKLQHRFAVRRWYRTLLLCLLGAIGGVVTAWWVVDSNVVSLITIARMPLGLVEGVSNSRIALVLVLVFAARIAQQVTRRL